MSIHILSLENLDSVTIREYLSTLCWSQKTTLFPHVVQGSTHSSGSNVLYFSMIHVQVLRKLPKLETLENTVGYSIENDSRDIENFNLHNHSLGIYGMQGTVLLQLYY